MNIKKSLWSRNYILLILAEFLIFFNFAMESTTLSKYLVDNGYSVEIAGIVVGAMSIAALLGRPFIGWLCDRFHKKHFFLIAILIYSATVFGYTIAGTYQVFVILRVLHGISFGVVTTLIMVLLGSNIPSGRMGEGMGIASIASSLAFAFGPNLAITIGNNFKYTYIFYVAVLCALLAGVFVIFLPYERKKTKNTKFSFNIKSLIAKEALLFAAIICISSAVCGVSNSYIAIYSNEFTISNIGWYFTIGSIFAMFSKYIGGKISDKFGFAYAIVPGILITMGSLVVLGTISNKYAAFMFIIATVMLNLGTAGLDPVLQAKVLNTVSEERRGAAASTFYLGADLGQAIGPIAGGMLVQGIGYANMYMSFMIPLILILLLFMFVQVSGKSY